ncbi:MAG: hypothetical protein WCN27_01775 [Alphaproteobacteria bacterium]
MKKLAVLVAILPAVFGCEAIWNNGPTQLLRDIFEISEIDNVDDLKFATQQANFRWIRPKGYERWHIYSILNDSQREKLTKIIKKSALAKAKMPTKKHYHAVVVLGATTARVKKRMEFLMQLANHGVTWEKVFLLGSTRDLNVGTEQGQRMEIFLKNLISLLKPYLGKESLVFFPTAHPRELFACNLYNQIFQKTHKFSFALEFRHPLSIISTDSNFEFWLQYKILCEIWFKFTTQKISPNILIYTDTLELAKEYEFYLPVKINTLPIPFRSSFLGKHIYSPSKKLSLGYFGDARNEKGFQHLSGLHKFLKSKNDIKDNFKFIIQCTNANLWANGITVLDYFKTISPDEVELIGIEKPLTDNEYYHLVSSSDVCLLPYDSGIYRSRSSGCLSEAIAMGIPSVVPKNTWLEKQVPENCQVSFQTIDDFYNATHHLIKNYSYYHENMKNYKKIWLNNNTPKNLVIKLFEDANYGF